MDLRLRVQTLCASIVTSCEALVALFLEGSSFLYRHIVWVCLDSSGEEEDKARTKLLLRPCAVLVREREELASQEEWQTAGSV